MDVSAQSAADLIGHIYDAVIEPGLWTDTIDRIRRHDSAVAREAGVLAGLMLAFLAVYLCGFFDLSSSLAVDGTASGDGAL